MRLARDGREWLTFTTSDSTGGTLTVSFDDGDSWHELEIRTPTTARCLVAGPDAGINPDETVVVPVGTHAVLLRLVINSEIIIRPAPEWLTVV